MLRSVIAQTVIQLYWNVPNFSCVLRGGVASGSVSDYWINTTSLSVLCKWLLNYCSPPSEHEVVKALSHLKNGKATEVCNLPAELLKNAGPDRIKWLTAIFQSVWSSGNIPDDWHRGIILPLHKGKSSRHDCCNYRGISLLSVPGKTLVRILLSRVNRRIQQSGFTPGRSTIDRIATLNMLHQTRREFNRSLWVACVDLKAAFDSVDHNALWDLLTSLGIPPKIRSMFVALYTGTMSCVRVDGHNSEWFPIPSGVRQGCTVAPDLFLVPMDWFMEHTSHHGMLFSINHLQLNVWLVTSH